MYITSLTFKLNKGEFIMRKRFFVLCCILSILFSIFGNVLIINAQESVKETEQSKNASLTKNSYTDYCADANLYESLNIFKQELTTRGTDVITELENQISYYENMLSTINSAEKAKQIQNLISTTERMITEYQSVTLNSQHRDLYSDFINMQSSLVSYCQSYGYSLAAELLTHSFSNTNLDSIYMPINSDKVLQSNVYTNIKNGTILEHYGEFINSSNANDIDLYLAIHFFNFSKSASNRVIVIQDRYDYELDSTYDTIISGAVNVMYAAQQVGLITPFYSVITHNFSGTISNPVEYIGIPFNEKYFEDKVTLGTGEYKDYYITFNSSGTKIFQSFGPKDTRFYLYDSNDNLIISNDDGGFSSNAFIRYYCTANTRYKLRVNFYSSSASGETKLAITQSYGAKKSTSEYLDTYEDIYNTNSSNYTFNTFYSKGYVRLFTYTPSQTAYYTIETEGDTDTYLYLLDPRLSALIDLNKQANDDGGDGYNASISMKLSANTTYLIVYSNWSLANEDSDLVLKIYRN